MKSTTQWCVYNFDVDISLGVWAEYEQALNFLEDCKTPENNWALIPYEETLEYIVN